MYVMYAQAQKRSRFVPFHLNQYVTSHFVRTNTRYTGRTPVFECMPYSDELSFKRKLFILGNILGNVE